MVTFKSVVRASQLTICKLFQLAEDCDQLGRHLATVGPRGHIHVPMERGTVRAAGLHLPGLASDALDFPVCGRQTLWPHRLNVLLSRYLGHDVLGRLLSERGHRRV